MKKIKKIPPAHHPTWCADSNRGYICQTSPTHLLSLPFPPIFSFTSPSPLFLPPATFSSPPLFPLFYLLTPLIPHSSEHLLKLLTGAPRQATHRRPPPQAISLEHLLKLLTGEHLLKHLAREPLLKHHLLSPLVRPPPLTPMITDDHTGNHFLFASR
jgi:hypothetical protein